MPNDLRSEIAATLSASVWAMDERRLRALFASLSRMTHADSAIVAATASARGVPAPAAPSIVGDVAHIGVNGVLLKSVPWFFEYLGIAATGTVAVGEQLKQALGNVNVKRVQLDVDSPGGTVDGIQELADAIRSARAQKPITASISNIAASAAYWLASQADAIDANAAAEVGSIGVYTVIDDLSAMFEDAGIKTHVVRSHPLKGAGVEGAPVTDEQLADVQRIINGYAALFADSVALGRQGKMTREQVAAHATGQTWLGADALAAGLIDSVRSEEIAATAGVSIAAQGVQPAAVAAAAVAAEGIDMDPQELEKVKAENEKVRADAAKAHAESEERIAKLLGAQRKSLLDKFADRFAAANRPAMERMAAAFGDDFVGLEATFAAMPKIVRDERASAELAVDAGVALPKPATGPETLAERELCKYMGQSVDRLRDMSAIGDAVVKVEHELVADSSGQLVRKAYAVLKDGRRLDRTELRKALGLKGAVAALLVCLSSLFSGDAQAALSAARVTDCKGGVTRACLMTASKTVYSGGLVMVVDAGTCEAAAASASNNGVAGVAQETKTSAASGSYWLKITDKTVCKFAGTTLGQDDVGVLVYAESDETVDETASANEPVAGVLYQYVSASLGWVYIDSAIAHGRMATTTDPLTMTGDLTLSGGAGAATFTDSASSIVLPDADATALLIGSTGMLGLMTFDTTDGNEELNIVGTTATSSFRVDTGFATFDEQAVFTAGADNNDDVKFGGGAGAVTFDAASSSIVTTDNSATGLDIGSTGLTNALRYVSTDDAEVFIHTAGFAGAAVSITGVTTLDYSNCGKPHFVTAGIDTASITLPALATVTAGCELTFFYVGADDQALVDISPNSSDGIEGSCTLAASVVTFSGTDDADIGLTKVGGNKGDTITLVAGNADDWYVKSCAGIWANN